MVKGLCRKNKLRKIRVVSLPVFLWVGNFLHLFNGRKVAISSPKRKKKEMSNKSTISFCNRVSVLILSNKIKQTPATLMITMLLYNKKKDRLRSCSWLFTWSCPERLWINVQIPAKNSKISKKQYQAKLSNYSSLSRPRKSIKEVGLICSFFPYKTPTFFKIITKMIHEKSSFSQVLFFDSQLSFKNLINRKKHPSFFEGCAFS